MRFTPLEEDGEEGEDRGEEVVKGRWSKGRWKDESRRGGGGGRKEGGEKERGGGGVHRIHFKASNFTHISIVMIAFSTLRTMLFIL